MYVVAYLQANYHIDIKRRNVFTEVNRRGSNASLVVTYKVKAENSFVQPPPYHGFVTQNYLPHKNAFSY
jgi:hypothetical protein